jgi:hypothetical protein
MNKFIQYILDSKFYIYIYDKLSDIYVYVHVWWAVKLKWKYPKLRLS